jgi:hypothetical protein
MKLALRAKAGVTALFIVLSASVTSFAGQELSIPQALISTFHHFEKQYFELRLRVQLLPKDTRDILELETRIGIIGVLIDELKARQFGDSYEGGFETRLSEVSQHIDELQFHIDQAQIDSRQKMVVPFSGEIPATGNQTLNSTRLFSSSENRIAVFTLDDPASSGLGDPASFVLSKEVLFAAKVRSVAVVNYSYGAARDGSTGLAYFDKVDLITRDQGFMFALWGRISGTKDRWRVETFIQVPFNPHQRPFEQVVALPRAMGGGELVAKVDPDRVKVDDFEISDNGSEKIRAAASAISKLRQEPNAQSPIVATLAPEKAPRRPFTITKAESEGSWFRLSDDRASGWTSVTAFCVDECMQLLGTARFADNLLSLVGGDGKAQLQLGKGAEVTSDARAFQIQILALTMIEKDPRAAVDLLKASSDLNHLRSPSARNLLAVARLAQALEEARKEQNDFDDIRLQPELIKGIADELAKASVEDPGNLAILDNLAILFSYLGDNRRHDLATRIADSLRSSAPKER